MGNESDNAQVQSLLKKLAMREKIQWLMIVLLILLGAFNAYHFIGSTSSASVTLAESSSLLEKTRKFTHSYILWVPKFDSPSARHTDPAAGEAVFHAWIKSEYGGWTRWDVQGDEGAADSEPGWLYLISSPKSRLTDGPDVLLSQLQEHFRDTSFYLIQIPHH